MTVNAYKQRFDISFLRKYFLILRASTRHIIRKINYERQHYSRGLGLKQNKRQGIAGITPFTTLQLVAKLNHSEARWLGVRKPHSRYVELPARRAIAKKDSKPKKND